MLRHIHWNWKSLLNIFIKSKTSTCLWLPQIKQKNLSRWQGENWGMGCKILISWNYSLKKNVLMLLHIWKLWSENTLHIVYNYFISSTCILATRIHKISHPGNSSREVDQRHCEANTPSRSWLRVGLPPEEQLEFV